jgi:hypothetical protein
MFSFVFYMCLLCLLVLLIGAHAQSIIIKSLEHQFLFLYLALQCWKLGLFCLVCSIFACFTCVWFAILEYDPVSYLNESK